MRQLERFRTVGLACIFLLLTACQTPAPTVDHQADFAARMQPYLGVLTYAEAVERSGIPTRRETMPDGGIVAEWTTSRGGIVIVPGLPGPGGMPMPTVAAPVSSGATM